MFFAFFCLIALSTVVAYALYLDKPWLAGILGGTTIVSVISLFVRKDQDTVSKSVSQLSCKKRTGQVWPVLTSL